MCCLISFAAHPFIGEKRLTCETILAARKDTMTGAKGCLHDKKIYLYLLVSRDILLLIETAVKISEILHRIFCGFYNCTRLHHELCKKIITRFHSGIFACVSGACTKTKDHFLAVHQHRKSRKLFEEARRSASIRHPGKVPSSTVVRLQAKATFKTIVEANHVGS